MKYPFLLVFVVALGCGGSSETTTSPPDATEDVAVALDTTTATPPDTAALPDVAARNPADWYTFEAGPFTVPAGTERFFCFAHNLTEDVTTNEMALDSRPVVHHVLFSQTRSPDPDGFFECSVLFQNNWSPIFVAGTGDATLKTPPGSGYVLKKGQQLTMQLHLVNAKTVDVTETVPMNLKRVTEAVDPVNVVVFGNMSVALKPQGPGQVIAACKNSEDMHLFAAFPHMHLLGRALRFSTGPDQDHLTEVFKRDPYDFNYQYMEPLDLVIKGGDAIRVQCDYQNDSKDIVTFGESTKNEMCFFIGFATGVKKPLAGCIGGPGAGGFLPEGCGTDPVNDHGIGATCSKGGNECKSGLMCTEEYDQIAGPKTCIGIGCTTSADCGNGGAVCCAPKIAGMDIHLCVPPKCEFAGCNPQ